MQQIVIVNATDTLAEAEVRAAVAAVARQVHEHFAPAWGVDAEVRYSDGRDIGHGDWVVALVDESDQEGALGYHDVLQGEPDAKVAVASTDRAGASWTVVLSHEVLEMLADPYLLSAAVQVNSKGAGRIIAVEVCDPCEGDDAGYRIDNVLVSDFVLPAWFDPLRTAPFDQAGKITRPGELLPGGYISVLDFATQSGWRQILARKDFHCRDRIAARIGTCPSQANVFEDLRLAAQEARGAILGPV